ncbi:MAG: DUF4270 family protein [Bacteroidota bacterium]
MYVFLLVFFARCGTEASEIGSGFFNGGDLDISYIDSVSVKLSTIKYDSLITSNTERLLAGSFDDSRLGRITASSFFIPELNGSSGLDEDNHQLVYASITMFYDEYSYYDTTSLMTLYAYRLKEQMTVGNDGYLYSTSSFAINPQILGAVTFSPQPHKADSLEIKLSPSFSLELFNKAIKGHSDLENNANFAKYIKGFVIAPDSTISASLVGFDLNAELRLYYLDKTTVPSSRKYISFPVKYGDGSSLYFTKIQVNHSRTKLGVLRTLKNKLAATENQGEAYLQGSAGLALRVDMPYLRSLAQLSNFYITEAVLDIYPVKKSYNKLTPLPSKLTAHRVNGKNIIYADFASDVVLFEDADLGRDTYYTVDITAFVKDQMATQQFNENALLLRIDWKSFRSGADRLYATLNNGDYKTRVRIYYATIHE